MLNYIKYSKDEKGLAKLLEEDERLKTLEVGAARVIETITNTDFAIDEKTEVVNVCQAVEDMMKTREQKGWQQGEQQGSLNTLIRLVRKGLLSVADAASEAGLSCEAFEQQMRSQVLMLPLFDFIFYIRRELNVLYSFGCQTIAMSILR